VCAAAAGSAALGGCGYDIDVVAGVSVRVVVVVTAVVVVVVAIVVVGFAA
jgi:hypothetical protein